MTKVLAAVNRTIEELPEERQRDAARALMVFLENDPSLDDHVASRDDHGITDRS
jgi:hypothetical protein